MVFLIKLYVTQVGWNLYMMHTISIPIDQFYADGWLIITVHDVNVTLFFSFLLFHFGGRKAKFVLWEAQ